MKLLVTGASGFIGSHLIRAASKSLGHENVIAFSSTHIDLCSSVVYEGAKFGLTANDLAVLEGAEVLIHVGAFTPKNRFDANALEKNNGNIRFTEQLLNLPMPRLQKIVYASTTDVYAPVELTTEATPTLPETLYGWSKLYCEQMVSVFAAKRSVASQILRLGHVFGPGEETYAKFLPEAMKRILAGRPVELWGDGREIRSFIYVDDAVSAILASCGLPSSPGPINVVGGRAISVRALLEELAAISRHSVKIVEKKQRGDKRNFVFDNSKMRKFLLPTETDLITGLKAEYAHLARIK